MRVLVISDVKTHPVDLGSSKFITEYCDLIRSLGHDVFFLYVIRYTTNIFIKNRIMRNRTETKKAWGATYIEFQEPIFSFIRRKLLWYYRKLLNHGYIHCDDKYYIGLDLIVQNVVKSNSIDTFLLTTFGLQRCFRA